jgi:hypothetical protein
MADWMPEEELELLRNAPKADIVAHAVAEQEAMDVFRRNLPLAAEVIVSLAQDADKESVRLSAAKYVVERVMGAVGQAKQSPAEDSMWEKFFGSVTREPTAEERQAGISVSRL